MWHTGQADGYLELLQDFSELLTSQNVATAVVAAGGSGYAVGDILGVNGGTTVGGHKAAVEVLTLSGSAVATVRLARCGAYTVNPGTGASTTAETGAGTGCTITTTLGAAQWSVERRSRQAVSATIAAGGTGYTVGDQLTVVLGAGAQGQTGVAAVFQVTTAGFGVVTAVSLVTAGNYEVMPPNPVLVTGGTGSGCQLNITSTTASGQDQVLVLEGTASGGFEAPIVAIETYQDVDQFIGTRPVRNWALFGLVNFNASLALHEQVNISTGHDIAAGNGDFLTRGVPSIPLKETDASYPLTFWFSWNGRRIIGIVHTTDSTPVHHYPSFYLGFLNQAGTAGEFPYPMYVGGSSWRRQAQYAETTPVIGGISEAPGSLNTDAVAAGEGSAYFWDSGTAKWYASLNFDFNDQGTSVVTGQSTMRAGLYPLLAHFAGSDAGPTDVFGLTNTNSVEWHDEIIDRALPAAPTILLYPTPNGASGRYLLVPLTLWAKWTDASGSPTQLDSIYGELDQCFWFSATPVGDISTLDTFLIGSDRYRIFQNGNRTEFNSSYFAILEE